MAQPNATMEPGVDDVITNNVYHELDQIPLMVHVIAPASLPEGYTFEAQINGDSSKTFACEVVSVHAV